MKKGLLFFIILPLYLCAQVTFDEALQTYKEGNKTAAFASFQTLYYNTFDEDAAFYVAKMYDLGEGVQVNTTKALKWYKIAAQRYHTATKDQYNHSYNKQRRLLFRYAQNIDDNTTKKTLQQIIESRFEFKAHNHNYFLPFGYQENIYPSYVASDVYTNTEAEFQLSVRFDLKSNLLGLNEVYSGAFTQRSFWQIYANSAPFRENNYMPELFITFPLVKQNKIKSLKAIVVGMAHQSNGQGSIETISNENPLGSRSRSWNFVYSTLKFQFGSVLMDIKAWKRVNEDPLYDDNPDLTDYIGHGSLKFTLPYKNFVAVAEFRHNARTGGGSSELNLSFPVDDSNNVFWYGKFFSGYGESLIDYDNYITKSSFGISFSR